MLIEGRQWGNTDSEATLFHQVEAERHWWACGYWKIPSKEEDLRHRSILTEKEFDLAHRKQSHIWSWEQDVMGFNLSIHLKGES